MLLLVLSACSALEDPEADPSPGFVDKDCVDFATQAKAQRFFERQGGPEQDPHLLDPDHDGIACETRPCPCLGFEDPPPEAGGSRPAEVVYVSDGDTIGVRRRSGDVVPVRLLGIDAPETKGTVECGGRASSARLTRLLPRGTHVVLVSDPTQDQQDRFGRLLRYVELDGVDLGLRQVQQGLAEVYDYDRPVFSRFTGYDRAERKARNAGRGSWGRC